MPWKNINDRRQYHREYSQRDYVKQKKKEYMEKTKEQRSLNAKKYRDTKRICEWKRAGVKGDLYELSIRYKNTTHCDICNTELCCENKSKSRKCLDHDHLSGHFRNILCNSCNAKRQIPDKLRMTLMLELHRYFNVYNL